MQVTIRKCDMCRKEMPMDQAVCLNGDKPGTFAHIRVFTRALPGSGYRGLPPEKDVDMCIECFQKEFSHVIKPNKET